MVGVQAPVGHAGVNADGKADARAAAVARRRQCAHAGDQVFHHQARTVGRRVRQHQCELVAAIARGHVARAARMCGDQPCHVAQHAVTHLVAVSIVVMLEMVHVDQGQAQRLATAPRGIAFLLQGLFETQAVAEPGQRIAVGLAVPGRDAPDGPHQHDQQHAELGAGRCPPQAAHAQQQPGQHGGQRQRKERGQPRQAQAEQHHAQCSHQP